MQQDLNVAIMVDIFAMSNSGYLSQAMRRVGCQENLPIGTRYVPLSGHDGTSTNTAVAVGSLVTESINGYQFFVEEQAQYLRTIQIHLRPLRYSPLLA